MHCHSRLSDGSLQPETVVRLAAFKGIDTLSITDHDCVSGTKGHLALGEKYGIHIIPGAGGSGPGKRPTGACALLPV
ncbi:PHP domain-containing protein [Akkermansia muciniphila]|uniref:PHP domain-containing protein n=1 Tax=Akkermansia muciniphila TaxID=239935 RepID=UPI0034E0BF66